MNKIHKKGSLASKTVVSNGKVRDGSIRVFPQTIINDLDEFNEKYNTSFSYDAYVEDIVETLRKTYNTKSHSDYSYLKENTKNWFNAKYYPYAIVRDIR